LLLYLLLIPGYIRFSINGPSAPFLLLRFCGKTLYLILNLKKPEEVNVVQDVFQLGNTVT
jgi:hypothetical protein